MPRTEIPLVEEVKPAWQRRDVLLFVLHDGRTCDACAAVRRMLASPPPQLRGPELALIVVEPKSHSAERLREFGELPGDRRHDAAVVLVADRFLEFFAAIEVHGRPLSELVDDLAGWVEAVQRQCGECSRM